MITGSGLSLRSGLESQEIVPDGGAAINHKHGWRTSECVTDFYSIYPSAGLR